MKCIQLRTSVLAIVVLFAVSCHQGSSSNPPTPPAPLDPPSSFYGVSMEIPKPASIAEAPGHLNASMKVSNGTSVSIFGTEGMCEGRARFASLDLLDVSGSIVASSTDDCTTVEPFQIGSGETLSAVHAIDLSSLSGNFAEGIYVVRGRLFFGGPLEEGELPSVSDSILTFPRVSLPVLVQSAAGSSGSSEAFGVSLWSLHANTDQPVYPEGGMAKIDAILLNHSAIDILAESPTACEVQIEIIALDWIHTAGGSVLDETVVYRFPQACAAVMTPLEIPSGSALERSFTVPLVDDQGVILPPKFYLIRAIFQIAGIASADSAYDFGPLIYGEHVYGVVDVPIRIL